MNLNLTTRQEEVLDFIKSYSIENGFSPVAQEIGDNFGFSHNAAICHLNALKRKGKISTKPKLQRSIVVLEEKTA